MRTSLTLDNDLADRLKEAARQAQKPFAEVVNDTLRAGLNAPPPRRRPFVVRTFRSCFKAGVDETKLNQLVDQLETEALLDVQSARLGARAMLGFARRLRPERRSTADWLTELREGETPDAAT